MGCFLKISILILCTCAVVRSEDEEVVLPERVNTTTAVSSPITPPQRMMEKPIQPKTPDCYQFFPGTPGWNECFQRFTQAMALYQMQMHDYVKGKSKEEGTIGTTNNNGGGGEYYSESSYTSSKSTSNSFVAGYAIRAINMAISTSVHNGILKIILQTGGGPIENFDSNTNGNEIKFRMLVRGQPKEAKIVIPNGVRLEDIKVDRAYDAIYVTAPAQQNWNGGRVQMSQSSSGSAGNSNSFSQSFQSFGGIGTGNQQSPNPPPVVLPDFNNMFGNMFQNMFSVFGGKPNQVPNHRVRQNRESFYPGPQMWHY